MHRPDTTHALMNQAAGACMMALLIASGVSGQTPPSSTGAVTPPERSDSSSAAISALRSSGLILVTGDEVVFRRTRQLITGVAPGESLLLRSPSSITPPDVDRNGGWRASLIAPQVSVVLNSGLPFSQNDGGLWAGKGLNGRIMLGGKLERARLRLIFAPEIVLSANADWALPEDFYVPEVPVVPSGRGSRGYVLPYVFWTFPIDQPLRFGAAGIRKFTLGQSTAVVTTGPIALGASTENEWWGPGIRNAIVLSNNAPGFPHFFIRTLRPFATRFGSIDARWIVGGLQESKYFDTVSTNNVRSIASFAAALQTRWDPNLSVGFARSVFATANGWGQIPWRWFDALLPSNSPGDYTPNDPTNSEVGKDHLYSLFARWVFPSDGVEVYAEWARRRFPASFNALLTAANHTHGYTIGTQWRGGAWRNGAIRVHAEVTQLEQSPTFRSRPVGSWYASPRVTQGYTHRGEVLGAAIGPGASSQWLAVDYLKVNWTLGGFIGRIRTNEDVHSTFGFPDYVAYCSHDVTIYPGIRGTKVGSLGSLSAELSLQNRLNAFFQNAGGCPNNGRRLDIRNNVLSVSFTPFR